MDEPNQGQIYTIPKSGRTQPGLNLQVHKVEGSHQGSTRFTKWTNPTRVKLISPQSGRIPPRVNTVHKWTDPTRVKLISPQSGRTQQGSNLYKSTKWTAIRGHDHIPRNGQTQPVHKIIQVHKVDGHQGSRPHSTEWTDPTSS